MSEGRPVMVRLAGISSRVMTANARLDSLLIGLGLTPSPVGRGVSYKMGHRSLCRIDPKREFLRVYVGEASELSAPSELRGQYRQRGWLVVSPEHTEEAARFLEAILAGRLHGA